MWVILSRKSPQNGSIWKYGTGKRSKLIQCLGYFYVLEETLWADPSQVHPRVPSLNGSPPQARVPDKCVWSCVLGQRPTVESGGPPLGLSLPAGHVHNTVTVSLRVSALTCHPSLHPSSRGSSPGLKGQWWVQSLVKRLCPVCWTLRWHSHLRSQYPPTPNFFLEGGVAR